VFDKETFWEEVKRVKNEYDVRISSKHSARSAKRITILVSTAFLSCIGGASGTDYLFHWTQCLEAELFRACKEKRLDCDPLELEGMERNYFCRKTQKKVFATAFDNHRISAIITGDIPKARLFANITTDLLTLEEVKDDQKLSGVATEEELCEILKVKKWKLTKLRKEGLPFIRVDRTTRFYTAKGVLEFLEKRIKMETG